MYYHESLPTLLSLLLEYKVIVDIDTVVIRDAVGRLTVGRKEIPNPTRVTQYLTMGLGGYAARPPIVDGALAERLLNDPAARLVEVSYGEALFSLRYIDRRLAGNDWLTPSTLETPLTSRFVFASIKGGVGRSTALCVLAANLAGQGKRVLAVDLDLEAPGIGFMLLPNDREDRDDRRPKFGVIDYLVENGIEPVADEALVDFIGTSSFHDGSIDVIPAIGRVIDDNPRELLQKLPRAVIEDVQGQAILPFWKQVSEMIKRFEARKQYDVVLIDARAGLADISAAPILSLGAQTLLFGIDQQQTFRGYRFLLSHVTAQTDFALLSGDNDWRQNITFVQSKAPGTLRAREGFRERIYDLCEEWLYESEDLSDGSALTFSPAETGSGVPHDATFIRNDIAYEAFDPAVNGDQLDPEVYAGPFGTFLRRIDTLIPSPKGHLP